MLCKLWMFYSASPHFSDSLKPQSKYWTTFYYYFFKATQQCVKPLGDTRIASSNSLLFFFFLLSAKCNHDTLLQRNSCAGDTPRHNSWDCSKTTVCYSFTVSHLGIVQTKIRERERTVFCSLQYWDPFTIPPPPPHFIFTLSHEQEQDILNPR